MSVSITFTLNGNANMKNHGIHITWQSGLLSTSLVGYVMLFIFIFQCISISPAHMLSRLAGVSEGASFNMSTIPADHEMPFHAKEKEAEMPLSDIDELIVTSLFNNNHDHLYSDSDLAYMVLVFLSLKIVSIPTPPPDLSI